MLARAKEQLTTENVMGALLKWKQLLASLPAGLLLPVRGYLAAQCSCVHAMGPACPCLQAASTQCAEQ